MSAGHTPGPWEAERLGPDAKENERPWVGLLKDGRYAALACGETQAEAVANAHLIAAALDLDAALGLLLDALDGKIADADYGKLAAVVSAARAKARGDDTLTRATSALNDETNEMVAVSQGRLG